MCAIRLDCSALNNNSRLNRHLLFIVFAYVRTGCSFPEGKDDFYQISFPPLRSVYSTDVVFIAANFSAGVCYLLETGGHFRGRFFYPANRTDNNDCLQVSGEQISTIRYSTGSVDAPLRFHSTGLRLVTLPLGTGRPDHSEIHIYGIILCFDLNSPLFAPIL